MSIKLLKNLNFAEKINGTEAVTEAGKEILKGYRAYVYSNAPTCGIVNGFLLEASKCTFDTGLNNIVESVKEYINENNISWKLASACESISNNNSVYNYISKLGVEQVTKLLEMNENDVVSYIKAGVLKNIQYIPEFRQVCKEVYKQNITETQAPNYSVTNPVSYIYMNENKEQFIYVLGKTYKIAEGKVSESICDDKKFLEINALLEHFSKDGDNIFVEMKGAHGDKVRLTLNENGLDFVKTGFGQEIKEHFDDVVKFQEYANTISKIMTMNEKLTFMNLTSNVAKVFEAMDNIVALDNVKVINTSNGTICALVEAKDNVNLTVFRNIKQGTGSYNYDYVVEALNNVIKLTGIDLKAMYEERINEDCKKANSEENEIREQLEANKEAQYDIRKKKIAMLAEKYKNDPLKITLLNKIAKDLSLLEKAEEKKEEVCPKCGKKECECKKDCKDCKDCKDGEDCKDDEDKKDEE